MVVPFKFYLSGGAANSDPVNSFGGAISTTETTYMSHQWDWEGASEPVPWLSIDYAFGLSPGTYQDAATPHYTMELKVDDTVNLIWDLNGVNELVGSVNTGGVNGQYEIVATLGARVGIEGVVFTFDNTTSPDFWRIYFADPPTNMFSDITKEQSVVGKTDYRCIAIKNTSGAEIDNIDLFFPDDVNASGVTYALGIDSAGMVDPGSPVDATQPVADTDAPVGVTFSVPLAATPFNFTGFAIDNYIYIWIQRTITVNSDVSKTPEVLNILTTWFNNP